MADCLAAGASGTTVAALNREWDGLVGAHLTTANRWSAAYDALRGCASLDDVLRRAAIQSDAVLAALLVEVAHHHALAARVVLQSMLGRMVAMARRDHRAGVDDYLSALWCVIISYPLARRPTGISANLSMDTLKVVSSDRRWHRRTEVVPWPPSAFLDPAVEIVRSAHHCRDPEASSILAVGLELGLLDRANHGLLHSVYVDGLSSEDAARRHRSSAGAVRVRCSRSVRRLAESTELLAEVA